MRTIGIDIGTTTIGYAVVEHDDGASGNADDRVLASDSFAHHAALAAPDQSCQDPAVLCRLASDTFERLRREWGRTAAVTVSGQMHGVLYLDAHGEPCSPLYTWLYSGACAYLAEIKAKSGYAIPAGYGIATHYAHVQNGTVPAEAVALCTIMDYAVMQLAKIDTPVSDPTCAASLGAYRIAENAVDRAALAALGIEAIILPRIAPTASQVGITDEGATTVTAPIGDNQASYVGACALDGAPLLLNIGTSGQIVQRTTRYADHPHPAIEWRPFVGGDYLAVGAVLSGGKSIELLARFCAEIYELYAGEAPDDPYRPINQFQRAHTQFSPSDSLRVDTRFAGSRADPLRRGAVENIGVGNFHIGEMIYGTMEGVIEELHTLWEQSSLHAPTTLVGSGSALRQNPFLQRIAANRWQTPLQLSPHREEAAVGAARIAYAAIKRNYA